MLVTEPRFELKMTYSEQGGHCQGIAPQSPAGIFLRRHQAAFQKLSIEFLDPHEGRGGLGASSAQFALVWMAEKFLSHPLNEQWANSAITRASSPGANYHSLLSSFWQSGQDSQKASGYDLIAQICGGWVQYTRQPLTLTNRTWPFEELEVCLFHTGKKVMTYQHLQGLENFSKLPCVDFEKAALLCVDGLQHKNEQAFIMGVKEYWSLLTREKLVAPWSYELVNVLNAKAGVLAAKGCGALGSDVVLAVVQTETKAEIIRWIREEMGLSLVADNKQTTGGCEIKIEPFWEAV